MASATNTAMMKIMGISCLIWMLLYTQDSHNMWAWCVVGVAAEFVLMMRSAEWSATTTTTNKASRWRPLMDVLLQAPLLALFLISIDMPPYSVSF